MYKNKKVTIILGSNSFIGKELKKSNRNINFFTGSSSDKNCDFKYKIGDSLEHLDSKKITVKKIIYLSWERRNIKINNQNINIYGLKKVIKFCNNRKIPIYFASSLSAMVRKNKYGKLKHESEKLLFRNKRNKIFRIAMINHTKGGLIYKINKIFKNLPFILIPNKGEFTINTVRLETVINALIKNYKNTKQIFYVYDRLEIKFKSILNCKSKMIISIPNFLIKSILYLPYKLNLQNSSFNYDGFLSLVNDAKKKDLT